MERKFIAIFLFILLATDIFSLFSWSCLSSFQNSSNEKIDEFIQINSLNAKTIIVRMGYDAVTAIKTQKGIVVIDAGITNSLTAKYRNIIENKFKRNDFVYLINTHSHHDHIGGNQIFPEAEIVGNENCIKEIAEDYKDKVKIKSKLLKVVNDYEKELDTLDSNSEEWGKAFCQKIRYQYAYNDLLQDHIITYPSITFKDSLDLQLGDISLDLKYFGRAHSESDIIIHIPELKLLMTGDLFLSGGKPSTGDYNYNAKDTGQWGNAIQWILARWNKIDIIVGGHGQIMTQNDLKEFIENIKKCK